MPDYTVVFVGIGVGGLYTGGSIAGAIAGLVIDLRITRTVLP